MEPHTRYRSNLYLVGADPVTHNELESLMSRRVEEYDQAAVKVIGSCRRFFEIAARNLALDYIIIDCAPALSAVNQVLCFTSDYILPPCLPDYFSYVSSNGLLNVALPKWQFWHEQRIRYQGPADPNYLGPHQGIDVAQNPSLAGFALPSTIPQLLPFVVQVRGTMHPRELRLATIN